LKQDGRFGTIVAGNRADLVLLDANPLESVANLTRRAGVMVRGRWLPKSEIDRQLADLAARMALR
jgi:imidazolonepropionase-like amidohydrolase